MDIWKKLYQDYLEDTDSDKDEIFTLDEYKKNADLRNQMDYCSPYGSFF